MTTLVEKLREENSEELEKFAKLPLVTSILEGTITRERYKKFLSDLYHVVWHFCPAMAAAASYCPDSFAAVRYFLYDHMQEEQGHEVWVLEDCEAVGGAAFANAVKTGRPSEEIQAMIGFNYWVSEREHACGILGMVFSLEAIASRLAGTASAGVTQALGLAPPHGVKFLSTHGPMDTDHMLELAAVLNGIDDKHIAAVISNATRVNFRLFSTIFN